MLKSSVIVLDFPLFIKWYISAKCNLHCSHCYLTTAGEDTKLSSIINIIKFLSLKKVQHISFLGGEPLLRSDLEDIILCCSNNHIKCKIATNGILLSKDRIVSLRKAGLNDYQVSIEGPSPELNDPIRGKGSFAIIIKAIKMLKRFGCRVSIAITLSHANVSALSIFCKLAKNLRVDELRFAAFIPIGIGVKIKKRLMLTHGDIKIVKNELPILKKIYRKINFNSAFLNKESGITDSGYTFGCGAGTNSMVINSNLTVSACDLLTETERSKNNIKHPNDIEQLWKKDSLFHKWRQPNIHCTNLLKNNLVDNCMYSCSVANRAYGRNIFGS